MLSFEQDIYIPFAIERLDLFSVYTSGIFSVIHVEEDFVRRCFLRKDLLKQF